MSKEKCKHEEWNPCGNDFYSCRKCGILRTSQQVDLYAEKDKKIADLEAKLAESEKDRDVWKSMAKCGDKLTEKMRDEYQQLKQQLAEKDEQLDALNKFLSDKATEIESLRTKAYVNMLHQEMLELKVATQDQDKISFCIEQLEKVLPSIKATIELAENRHQMKDQVDIIIDNQIKTLGGEK